MEYEIRSGNGPAECVLAVSKFAEYLAKNYDGKIVTYSKGYNSAHTEVPS